MTSGSHGAQGDLRLDLGNSWVHSRSWVEPYQFVWCSTSELVLDATHCVHYCEADNFNFGFA